MSCFGMKSKKQQPNRKRSPLIQEPQFKRSKSTRPSIKDRVTATTVNSDINIINLNTPSFIKNDIANLSHDNELPSTSKRVSRVRNLPSK